MISIIIPVLNEAENIGKLLRHINESVSKENIDEVIVVDGGSTDGTKNIVHRISQEFPLTLTLVSSAKGRAVQMNTGVNYASGRIYYFLHADSLPPKAFDQKIILASKNGSVAGCFRMKFDSSHPILKFSQWFTRFNYRFCRGGDQSLFIFKEVFNELKGFNESYAIYEDCEFINRIYDKHGFVVLTDYVVTSARKYDQNGAWKLQYHFAIIHLKKWTGASARQLHQYYERHIAS